MGGFSFAHSNIMSNKDKPRKSPKDLEYVSIPIEWNYPPEIRSQFANHMLVQHDEHNVFISFFDLAPPVTLSMGDTESKLSELKKLDKLTANCVARVAISRASYRGFFEVFELQLKKMFPEASGKQGKKPEGNGKKGE